MKKSFCWIIGSFFLMASSIALSKGYYPHWLYAFVGGGGSAMRVSNLELRPKTTDATLTSKSTTDPGAAGFGGLGFKFKSIPIGFNIEYVIQPDLDYNSNPVYNGGTGTYNMRSTVQNHAIFANLFYDFHLGNEYAVPFVEAGAGQSYNKVSMDATRTDAVFNTDRKITRKHSFAWDVGLGIHLKLTDNVFFDIGYKHFALGRAQWGPWSTANWRIITKDISADMGYLDITVFLLGNQHEDKPPMLINT